MYTLIFNKQVNLAFKINSFEEQINVNEENGNMEHSLSIDFEVASTNFADLANFCKANAISHMELIDENHDTVYQTTGISRLERISARILEDEDHFRIEARTENIVEE